MENLKMAVVGLGATGSVVASALLSTYPEAFIVVNDTFEVLGKRQEKGFLY